MNAEVEDDLKVVTVLLSRRNLRAMLAKLDGAPPNSANTLFKTLANGWTVILQAEEDADHYGGKPGQLHPATERKLDDTQD